MNKRQNEHTPAAGPEFGVPDGGAVATLDPPAEQQPQAEAPETMLDRAIALSEQEKGRQAADEAEDQRVFWSTLAAILLRKDCPQEDDSQLLADLVVEGKVSTERLQTYAGVIDRARLYMARHDGKQAAHTAQLAAKAELRKMQARHLAEAKVIYKASRSADSRLLQAGCAAGELAELGKRWPFLFDQGDPPRLRE